MILHLEGDVNTEMVNALANALNANEEPITIYLCSPGGSVSSEQLLIHLINTNAERITLIGYGGLQSAAFTIFFKAECPTALLPYTIGMAHQAYGLFQINEKGLPKDNEDKFYINSLKAHHKEEMAFYKSIGLTAEELKCISEGNNLYLPYKRMYQIWKNRT